MMKRLELWDAFARTGRVEDYLRYRGVDIYDAAIGRGLEANARHETTTDALIIRENNNIGESYRFVTALTEGPRRHPGFGPGAGTRKKPQRFRHPAAFPYSRLSVYRGRDKYIIDDVEPLRVFFELRSDIEKLAPSPVFLRAGRCWPRGRNRQRIFSG